LIIRHGKVVYSTSQQSLMHQLWFNDNGTIKVLMVSISIATNHVNPKMVMESLRFDFRIVVIPSNLIEVND
jgi:hypothetical protein